jgi:Mlc titration factor MtfA (ptsG expression regulator)
MNIFISTVILILAVYFGRKAYIRKKRFKLMQAPTDPAWPAILSKNLFMYNKLPQNLKDELHSLMRVFIAEKNFEGCGGLTLTEEMKVTIAAEACVLMLNRKPSFYPKLISILIYPHSYFAKDAHHLGYGHYVINESLRMGESWSRGIVVLAWDHVKNGSMNVDNGHNVVFHEFAHQLDEEDESGANGVPVLSKGTSYRTWARVFCVEFERLRKETLYNSNPMGKIDPVIDSYGATNPAEFFAVVTEAFFDRPLRLQKKHPRLYNELKEYYKLDPLEWTVPGSQN